MKSLSVAAVSAVVAVCSFAFAKTEHRPDFGGGHIPGHGPPVARAPFDAHLNATECQVVDHHDGHPGLPHVDRDPDNWVGHNFDPHDSHYIVEHPWAHGHFTGGVGHEHVWSLGGGTPDLFVFNNWFWNVLRYDHNVAAGWNWSGDQVVIYDDPDHPGLYLAYNPRLGTYAHVEFLGQ